MQDILRAIKGFPELNVTRFAEFFKVFKSCGLASSYFIGHTMDF